MLSATDKERFARHVLLAEIGVAGQERLCAARMHPSDDADARAREIASEYLSRGGASLATEAAAGTHEVATLTSAQVARLAGDPALREAAAWLAGSFAAVEAIKAVVGVGQPAVLDAAFSLAAEAR